jgi:hypothetical protein
MNYRKPNKDKKWGLQNIRIELVVDFLINFKFTATNFTLIAE